MTDTELLDWMHQNNVTTGPQLDESWRVMGWYAMDTDGSWGTGKSPREAVVNLKAMMETK